MELNEMIGNVWPFYGVDGNTFKLGDAVFEAVEDPSDGYRSMMDRVDAVIGEGSIFFGSSIALVRVERIDERDFVGYQLVDAHDGHVWLKLGTDEYDDYYPCFTFRYEPKGP